MAVRAPNPNRIKINRTYTVEEAADALGVHKNTVRRWIAAEGLLAVTDARPHLIPGAVLKPFLVEKRQRQRTRCGPGEFYCFKCRTPRRPALRIADYVPKSPDNGMLEALCSECGSIMYRAARQGDLPTFRTLFEIQERRAERSISDPPLPLPNSDFR